MSDPALHLVHFLRKTAQVSGTVSFQQGLFNLCADYYMLHPCTSGGWGSGGYWILGYWENAFFSEIYFLPKTFGKSAFLRTNRKDSEYTILKLRNYWDTGVLTPPE